MSAFKFRQVSGASTNLTQVKQSGGNLDGVAIVNTNAAARFVKLYDSTDQPVVGTTIPAITFQIQANTATVAGQLAVSFPNGINFRSSIWMATTANAADSDSTAVASGDLITQLFVE